MLRRYEMCRCNVFIAVVGGRSSQIRSISRFELTTVPGCSARTASTDLRRVPGTGNGTPRTTTSTGPRSLTCSRFPSIPPNPPFRVGERYRPAHDVAALQYRLRQEHIG